MFRYLKAAFWIGVDIPGLGRLPLNAMGAAAFAILGFAEPALWLVGVGLEASALFAMTTSERFRKAIDARDLGSAEMDAETRRRALVTTLPPPLQKRLLDLARNCERVEEVGRQADDFVVATNRDALRRLEWVYLKLLVARNNLVTMTAQDSGGQLAGQIREIETALGAPGLSENLRQSKTATLAILKERTANVRRRKETLEEIDSDLTRIEAQVQLLLENTTMQGKPAMIAADIELASNLASSGLYGDSGGTIAALDQTFGSRIRE